MSSVLSSFETMLGALRIAFFVLASAAAVVCLIDWAVRTRRVSPFGRVARLMRQYVDPMLVPVERRIVRGGGAPSTAPWWALVVVVVGGIVVISLVQFLARQVFGAAAALRSGPRGIYLLVIAWTFGLLQVALLVRVVSSWFSLSPYSRWIRWSHTLTEWLLRPLRRIVPALGMVDVTPFVAYLLLVLLQGFLRGI